MHACRPPATPPAASPPRWSSTPHPSARRPSSRVRCGTREWRDAWPEASDPACATQLCGEGGRAPAQGKHVCTHVPAVLRVQLAIAPSLGRCWEPLEPLGAATKVVLHVVDTCRQVDYDKGRSLVNTRMLGCAGAPWPASATARVTSGNVEYNSGGSITWYNVDQQYIKYT
jgi:hypothetical protein